MRAVHIVFNLLLACVEPPPSTVDPAPSDTVAPAETDAEPSKPATTPAADPFAPPEPIPGVPDGVDLYDESTWSQLSVEDKDRMRAIRAELEYQRTGGRAASSGNSNPRVDPTDLPERDTSGNYGSSSRVDAWQERDGKLVTATAVTGVIWGTAIIATVILQVAIVNAAKDCIESPSNGAFASGNDCSDELRTVRRAGAGVYVAATIAGGAGIGMLVSGITLGVHRNNRPIELSVLPLRLRF